MKSTLRFWLAALLCGLLALGPLPSHARLFKAASGGTQVSMTGGLDFPSVMFKGNASPGTPTVSVETAMAATGDKIALLGYAKVAGRATGKVVSAAGGGSITWRAGTTTWANGTTAMDVGIQGWGAAGPMLQPDGVYGVKRTLAGGDGNVTTGATNTLAMTGGSGTSTISHGDKIAVVFDMTTRAGADSVIVSAGNLLATTLHAPVTNLYTAAAWRTTGGKIPNVVITSDDGTLITLEDAAPMASNTIELFADATNPDERGLVFQVPWNSKADGVWVVIGATDANADFTVTLYSDPLGTPASMGNFAVTVEQSAALGTDRYRFIPFASEVTLSANTNYAVAVRATGTGTVRMPTWSLLDAAHRALLPGGTTVSKVTRDGGAGAFTAEATPTTMYGIGVRLSSMVGGE